MKHLCAALQQNAYPGRGILIGRTKEDNASLIAYFIMGRSENSRNRIFIKEGATIQTQAFDPAKLEDPSLVIYAPVRMHEGTTVVTNGDQTDTIYEALKAQQSFESALETRCYEPDAPNYTPRISGILYTDGGYKLSILKRFSKENDLCVRQFFCYEKAVPGRGHFISTYQHDGTPLPSFSGEPIAVSCDLSPEVFAQTLWESLHPENKISLLVRRVSDETAEIQDIIYNKRLTEQQ